MRDQFVSADMEKKSLNWLNISIDQRLIVKDNQRASVDSDRWWYRTGNFFFSIQCWTHHDRLSGKKENEMEMIYPIEKKKWKHKSNSSMRDFLIYEPSLRCRGNKSDLNILTNIKVPSLHCSVDTSRESRAEREKRERWWISRIRSNQRKREMSNHWRTFAFTNEFKRRSFAIQLEDRWQEDLIDVDRSYCDFSFLFLFLLLLHRSRLARLLVKSTQTLFNQIRQKRRALSISIARDGDGDGDHHNRLDLDEQILIECSRRWTAREREMNIISTSESQSRWRSDTEPPERTNERTKSAGSTTTTLMLIVNDTFDMFISEA